MTEVTKTFHRKVYPAISPTRASNSQEGRTVLVAGASEGIGLFIAKAYAEANAKHIILISRSQAKLDDAAKAVRERNHRTTVSTRVCDLSDVSVIKALWDSLGQDDIHVDVLIASANYTLPPRTTDDAAAMIHFNMIAGLHLFTTFRDQSMPAAGPRKKFYIYISSASAHIYPYASSLMYSATKAGWTNYLCHVADSIPETEMRIVSLHPGAVFTSAVTASAEVSEDLPIWDDPSLSGAMGVWTAGTEAAFLHGRFIWANWDVEELIARKEEILKDAGLFKVGITGVDTFSLQNLVEVVQKFPRVRNE